MILLHKSIKRSEDYVRSLKKLFEINCKTIDGVIETFNNGREQGFVIKIYNSYNRDSDLCIWLFESLDEKNIQIAYGTHSNIDKQNNWIEKKKNNFKEYPIITDIKVRIIADLFDNIKKYYSLDEEISYETSFKI